MVKEGEPRLLLESVVLGVVGALAAQLFTWMLHLSQAIFLHHLAGYVPPSLVEGGGTVHEVIGPHGLWLIPIVTTLGGLLSGILVYAFAPEAEGHGTDTAVNAFHRQEGLIRPQVAPIKMLASAITIGSGGSAGREGPIALVAAGLGSVFATLTHRTEEERRLLLLIGMAAGLSAIFRSPMGTGVFAIEVLYGTMEFELSAFLYTMLASAVAYTVTGALVGFHSLFHIPAIPTPSLREYLWYAVLGILSGLVGTLIPETFYRIRDLFRLLPLPAWSKPALGGLAVGLIALRLPQVLGGGYGWMQQAINGQLAFHLLIVLIFAKTVALALSVASGGSGGVFAPCLYVGAMLGGAFALVLHHAAPVFVVVGMAAVFGAAARVPVATMLMVTEMAGGYHLLVPAGVAVMLSYLLQVRLSSFLKYRSLYEGQVPTREDSPAHYLEHIQVAMRLLGRRDLPVTDDVGHLDLLRLLRSHIHFDLPGHRQLEMGVLPEGSPLIGSRLADFYHRIPHVQFEIIAILRSEHVLLPHPQTRLQSGDSVIYIAAADARNDLGRFISPYPKTPETGSGPSLPEAA